MPALPQPRGDLSEALLTALRSEPGPSAHPSAGTVAAAGQEDLQLALYCCYELHYGGLPGVDERWEWEPGLLAFRGELEARFEADLVDRIGPPAGGPAADEVDLALRELIESDAAPSLSRHMEKDATLEQFREFAINRSAYQLKEADPHSWAIPRIQGPPKAALIEIQADEYGGGRPERMHSALFARSMAALGLDPDPGTYLDEIPAVTLATVNLMSLCGLHRRLRGAIVGHLAVFEMTSSIPNRRYANGLRRLGQGADATAFFDEHVEADAVHENIAAVDLAGGLVRQSPALAADVMWGGRALLALDGDWARALLGEWERGGTALRGEPGVRAAA